MNQHAIHLTKISVEGFRSCRHTDFEPNKTLSTLIGPNGAGKTNLLQAIRMLSYPKRRFPQNREDVRLTRFRLSATFQIGRRTVLLRSRIAMNSDNDDRPEPYAESEEWCVVKPESPKTWLTVESKPSASIRPKFFIAAGGEALPAHQSRKLLATIQNVSSFRRKIRYYSASQFTNPKKCPSAIEIDQELGLTRFRSTDREHQSFLYDMYSCLDNHPDLFHSYLEVVGKKGLGLISTIQWKQLNVSTSQIDVRVGGRIKKKQVKRLLVVPSVQLGRASLSFSQLSEGTFKTLALVFYLMTDESNLLLIEEPELCVHQGLLASIVELIKDRSARKQIVFSTHSDFVLDRVTPEQVFSVKRTDTRGTKVRSLQTDYPKQTISALKRYLQNSGNLGEFWRHGGLA